MDVCVDKTYFIKFDLKERRPPALRYERELEQGHDDA